MAVEGISKPAILARTGTFFSPLLLFATGGFLLALYYTLLLANGHLAPLGPEAYDHVFGNMLNHLLRGRFDVDRNVMGDEAFTRDGKVLSYFGIAPAVLRLLAMPFTNVENGDLARLSCLLAMLLYVGLQFRTLHLVHHAIPITRRSSHLFAVMLVATALSGPQIYMLGSGWIYHEPVFWAAALGAGYNFTVLQSVLRDRGLTGRTLVTLAIYAGVAINTRASVGAGLCLATGLLVLAFAWEKRSQQLMRIVVNPRFWAPIVVLFAFVAIAGMVNYERWGNPLKFADFRYYDAAHRNLRRLAVTLNYGELSLSRIPVGALYYTTGIPYLLKNATPFSGYFGTHFDGLEAPPMSGLITNPLTVILTAIGLWRLIRHPFQGANTLRLVMFGHAAAVLVVFSAMNLAMRYRLDFAPFMMLGAYIGYPVVSNAMQTRRWTISITAMLCIWGVAFSHYVLLVHKVWSTGVPLTIRLALLPYAPFAHAAFDP